MTDNTTGAKPTIEALVKDVADIMGGDWNEANAFLAMIEPESGRERSKQVGMAGGRGDRWVWPYEIRVKDCARQFMAMDKADQDEIKAASEDGIYWRGERIEIFRGVVDEAAKKRALGFVEYKRQALQRYPGLSDLS